jgi:hypothetical protein
VTKPEDKPLNIAFQITESGYQVRISDHGHAGGLRLKISDFHGRLMFMAESKLDRSQDWSKQTEKQLATITDCLSHDHVDRSVPGKWHYKELP